ncbi:hypothetical protein M8C21_018399 [Ambrosia artemisiifolia]|uniref:Uncharacterized protein n=1 Tax=Ambrosia artemisiifolia TaxID=4212 RepID=A0AAD5GH23_AMBAR|nr:hypothetical protein M8C21_018399 [Ambrosia artemisiifolia]
MEKVKSMAGEELVFHVSGSMTAPFTLPQNTTTSNPIKRDVQIRQRMFKDDCGIPPIARNREMHGERVGCACDGGSMEEDGGFKWRLKDVMWASVGVVGESVLGVTEKVGQENMVTLPLEEKTQDNIAHSKSSLLHPFAITIARKKYDHEYPWEP